MGPRPKSKLSKAEKEKLKRDEAEKRAKEFEEQRQREEKERLEEEERERQAEEERARLKALENERFTKESEKLKTFTDNQRSALDEWKQSRLHRKQWEHYLSCAELPDPRDEQSFNTFMNLFEGEGETLEEGAQPDISVTLKNVQKCLTLSEEINTYLYGDGYPQPTEQEKQTYLKALQRIRLALSRKLDIATIQYMVEADRHVDSETYNLSVEASIPGAPLTYCLWGNVIKNPRLKNFSFKEHSFVLELPKPLLLADVAVRLLLPPFDPLSPSCHTHGYQCPAPTPTAALEKEKGRRGDGGEGKELGTEAKEIMTGDSNGSREAEQKAEETPLPQEIQGNNKVENGEKQESEGEGGGGGGEGREGGEGEGGEGEGEEGKGEGEGEGDGVSESCEDEIDLRKFQLAGGPILLQALELPTQPKQINQWKIKRVVQNDLVTFAYPIEVPRPAHDQGQGQEVPPAPIPGSSAWPSIGMTLGLPETFVFSDQPQLARWDKDISAWRTKGLQGVIVDMEEKTVSFNTFYFSPLAIMVDKYLNMPYQSWQVLPQGRDHTHLRITGARTEITVSIKKDVCSLIEPSEEPALGQLLNKPFTARTLMESLSKVGVNLFPAPDAHKYVKTVEKDSEIEGQVYHHMAMSSCAYAFQQSRWNRDSRCSREQFILAACGCLGGGEQDASKLSWMLCVGGNRSSMMKLSEESKEFSVDIATGCEVHPDLYTTLHKSASPEGKQLMESTSPIHIETVRKLLTATKVLTFSS